MKARSKPQRPARLPSGEERSKRTANPASRKVKPAPLKPARPGRDSAIVKVES